MTKKQRFQLLEKEVSELRERITALESRVPYISYTHTIPLPPYTGPVWISPNSSDPFPNYTITC